VQDAVTALNSLQTNSSILEQLRKSGGRMNTTSLPEMREWLRRINYTPEDLNSLNMIHITGTKGKGSTCAFVSSILQQLYPHWRIGLFTSPHLKAVNERIQVNSVPISEDDFARYFWEVWDRLEAFEPMEGNEIQFEKGRKPVYFRFLTLMAWHAFLDMKVDTAIMEVGVGGEYDSTNLVTRPTATGVTSLGIDHVTVLGNTLESIAWHKGGIYKKDVAAFAVEQPEGALEVLRQRAAEKEVQPCFHKSDFVGPFHRGASTSSGQRGQVGDCGDGATK
jgi:folylpolyglutamate synthase